tara:strand:+ start:93 stop:521 length:429 start_codon:yes stop_codon:yes gene_type:complete
MDRKPASILIVDDDEVVIMGLQRTLKKMKFDNPSYTANDGIEALALLRGSAGNAPLQAPCLILLDLNMPRMNGHEFLEEIRNDPALRQSIIFVLTTSNSRDDKHRAYDKNVAGYIVKPIGRGTFGDTLSLLEKYQSVVDLPC